MHCSMRVRRKVSVAAGGIRREKTFQVLRDAFAVCKSTVPRCSSVTCQCDGLDQQHRVIECLAQCVLRRNSLMNRVYTHALTRANGKKIVENERHSSAFRVPVLGSPKLLGIELNHDGVSVVFTIS